MPGLDELRSQLLSAVAVSRADIQAAKTSLSQAGGETAIGAAANEWASVAVPGVLPLTVFLDREDVEAQVVSIARWISAKLAFCTAADELVQSGVLLAGGTRELWVAGVEHKSNRGGGGLPDLKPLRVYFPERVLLPVWKAGPTEILDADLYLQRVGPLGHSGIEQGVRMSLACFRTGLYVPCLAMLGAASEGSWVQVGLALAAAFPGPAATTLANKLNDRKVSTEEKIDRVCDFYRSTPAVDRVRRAARVAGEDAQAIADWSHQIREARNVLHWGAEPTLPNTYEKVAILLMTAAGHLSALERVRAAS